jgi:biotin carboxylase
MKRALLVDTSFSAGPIKDAAEAAGFAVFTVGSGRNNQLAIDSARHLELDYSNLEDLRRIFLEMGFERLIPGCNDKSYEMCCLLAESLNLPSFESAAKLNKLQNKQEFRQVCTELGLPAPKCFESQYESIEYGAKLIVKPVDSYSGRGISVVDAGDLAAVNAAVESASYVSAVGHAVIEEYVEGNLFSFSAFLENQRVAKSFHVAEFGVHNPFSVDVSYVQPDNPLEPYLVQNIEALARHIGLDSGVMHLQYLSKGDRYWLVEITRRCPGDLYSDLITMTTGFPYAEAFVAPFLGEQVPQTSHQEHQLCIRHTVNANQTGRLRAVHFQSSLTIERWYQLVRSGEVLDHESSRIGVGFYKMQDQAQLSHALAMCLQGEAAKTSFFA